jgi:para-aminobenzoate synthetase/4-amino-4-deoxychorismate lyase
MYSIQDPVLDNLLDFLRDTKEFVFLDTSRPVSENVRSFLFIEPVDRIVCRVGDDLEKYLGDLQRALDRGYYLAGWVGYEFGAVFEGKIDVKTRPCAPDESVIADFGVFEKPYSFNHNTGENNLPHCGSSVSATGDYSISNLRANMGKESYLKALEKVQDYIAAGDTYQVNYTLKLLFDFQGSPEKLYRDLRRNQTVAYGAYIRSGEERVLSFSPELFFKKNDSQITVRPMKGTAKRGRNGTEENIFRKQLHDDIKNRSENVMIVDLLRNDLSRLMHGHGESTVNVDTLFDIESYESLLQMTSTIRAQASGDEMGDIDLVDIFRALFPCGSITGAPKIRTMQIINELEKEQRGIYTGAIGFLAPDGNAVFNVPIRTIRLWSDKGEMGIGAGITHDSDPEEEWKESLLKGKFLTHAHPDFTLFETILWQPESGYWLLETHLKRLESSARFFKFSYDHGVIEQSLFLEESNFDDFCRRVRLTLRKDGRVSLTAMSCEQPAIIALPVDPQTQKTVDLPLVDFSDETTDTESPWCFYKTTLREIYDREYKKALQQGLFESFFCNEAGQVTEGCISNIIIYRQGQYLTPPVSSGLLPGVMRGELINDESVVLAEQILTKDMVESADAIFICNSVRGVVQVRLR